MTTIAVDASGMIAADSRVSYGDYYSNRCQKLYRKRIREGRSTVEVIIGVAGEVGPSLRFLDWYGSGDPRPDHIEGKFSALILRPEGVLEADESYTLEPVMEDAWAIGSGAMGAIIAMRCGKSAAEAVRMLCNIDPLTGGRVVSMRLEEPEARPRRKRKGSGSQ